MGKKQVLHKSLGWLQIFIALGAIAGGVNFLLDTSGAGFGFTLDLLQGTPFKDYLLPGLYLLLINGLGTLLAAVLSFRRHPLAADVGIVLGLALMGWIAAQILWVGYLSWLQPFYFVLGVLEVANAYLLRVRDKQFAVVH
jgi:hypothetical protein